MKPPHHHRISEKNQDLILVIYLHCVCLSFSKQQLETHPELSSVSVTVKLLTANPKGLHDDFKNGHHEPHRSGQEGCGTTSYGGWHQKNSNFQSCS
ncbi:uncharacterized protein LOC109922377 isoform X1 [Rhincodon typus]|uniref:uncharacterized protein LOC109922377 isoform X1 n=1 Tax=Rhincodon typus TaxID=259920 RepID=UPI00202E1637|nr:uncharacterized protein LOC109922377 isoform X1 [Rhincodon typus]